MKNPLFVLLLAGIWPGMLCTVMAQRTPGKDGPVTISSTSVVNTYYPATASAAAGTRALTLGTAKGATVPIAVGDLLLIIQMQGANIDSLNGNSYGDGVAGGVASGYISGTMVAGRYEFAVAANNVPLTGGSLSVATALVNSYTDAAYATTSPPQGQRRFQVVRVPQYSALTLNAGITAYGWDGACGGVAAYHTAGRCIFGSQTIDVSGKGFRGGAGRILNGPGTAAVTAVVTKSTNPVNGSKGEGICGTPRFVNSSGTLLDNLSEGYPGGSYANGAPGNAGGGATDGDASTNTLNAGGGGGGGGGAGGRGGNEQSASSFTIGGHAGTRPVTAATPSLAIAGGAGGAGSIENDGAGAHPAMLSSGAAGGGIIMISVGEVSGTGLLNANGSNASSTEGANGGGGGGAGGTVFILSGTTNLSTTLSVTANGGTGGSTSTTSTTPQVGPGGGGGGGIIYSSGILVSGTRTGGAAGTTTTSLVARGATSGSAGLARLNITATDVPTYPAPLATAFPVITTTLRTLTPQIANTGNKEATFVLTIANASGSQTATGIRATALLPAEFLYQSTVSIQYTNISGITAGPDDAGTGASAPSVLRTASLSINPALNTSSPAWGTFTIPPGDSVKITFITYAPSAPDGIYQADALSNFLDPTRTSASRLITADNLSGSNLTYERWGFAAANDVGGSNYVQASSTGENVEIGTFPVEWSYFMAERDARTQDVRLAWETASELNTAYFGVETSADGQVFVTLKEVKAAGFASTPQQYSYLDSSSFAHALTVYYRLKQVDTDGAFTYSETRELTLQQGLELRVIPNPVQADACHVQVSPHVLPLSLRLVTLTGTVLWETQLPPSTGTDRIHITAPELSAGTYLVEANTETESVSAKIVIE